MNEKAIQQLATAIDMLFGRPGSAQVALANIDLLQALADAVRAAEAQRSQVGPSGGANVG